MQVSGRSVSRENRGIQSWLGSFQSCRAASPVPTDDYDSATTQDTIASRPCFKRATTVGGLVAMVLLVSLAAWKRSCDRDPPNIQQSVDLDATSRMEALVNKLDKVTSKSAAENLVHRAMDIGSKEVLEKWEATKGHHAAAPERKLSAPARQLPNSFIDLKGQGAGEKQGTAQCIFDVMQAMTLAIGLGDDINAMASTCPTPRDGAAEVACQVNSGMLVAYIGTLAAKLSLAASSCAETANIDAICSGGVTGLVGALGELAATASLAAPSCASTPPDLPTTQISQLGVHRRLVNQTTADQRRLVIGEGQVGNAIQCGVDISMVAENLADFGLAINEAAESGTCNPSMWSLGDHVGSLLQSVCTVDIGGAIAYFAQAVTFINLAVVNCADYLDVKALCGASISGIATAAAAIAPYGAAINAACALNGLAKEATGGRRLSFEDPFEKLGNVTAKLRKAMDHMGYNSSNVTSGQEQVKAPMNDADLKKLLDLAEPAVDKKSFRGTWVSPVCQ